MIRQAPIPCILYARFSPRPNAAACESNLAQLESMREELTRRGGRVIAGEYEDADRSGDDDTREGLWDAVAACKRGYEFWIDDPERLARDLILGEVIREKIRERGATVVSVKKAQPATLEGELARKILAVVAEYRKKADAVLTSSRMLRHQATGRRVCDPARLPYGWALDVDGPTKILQDGRVLPSRMVPCPDEQAIIERILDCTRQGKKPPTIKKLLESEGILCRGKPTWNRTLIAAIIERGTTA